jgi:copper chaperone CopZ
MIFRSAAFVSAAWLFTAGCGEEPKAVQQPEPAVPVVAMVEPASEPNETVIRVDGMACTSCREAVHAAVMALEGVTSCEVSLTGRVAAFTDGDPVDPQFMVDAVNDETEFVASIVE